MISLIWAMDENRVIGMNNQLPWRLPEDLKFFKKVTLGHPIIMGRKTFDSIGKPLPGRTNIIVTRDQKFIDDRCQIMNSIDQVIRYAEEEHEEVFVIGGAEVFKEILPYASRLYLTMIHEQFEGDTFFPVFDIDQWTLISREQGIKNEENPYEYEFLIYQRKL